MHFVAFSHCTVIIQEPKQTDVNEKFNQIFDEIKSTESVSFQVTFFQLDHDRLGDNFAERKFFNRTGINCNFPTFPQ